MILVDMLAFAIDNPAPGKQESYAKKLVATICLISGDRDFVYALSTLRNRKYFTYLHLTHKADTQWF